MKILTCPKCGRMPNIVECVPHKNTRRRMCKCPNSCGVIPSAEGFNYHFFVYRGEGDDNKIFRVWNDAIRRFLDNNKLVWYEQNWSPWTDDEHIEK